MANQIFTYKKILSFILAVGYVIASVMCAVEAQDFIPNLSIDNPTYVKTYPLTGVLFTISVLGFGYIIAGLVLNFGKTNQYPLVCGFFASACLFLYSLAWLIMTVTAGVSYLLMFLLGSFVVALLLCLISFGCAIHLFSKG